MTHAGFSLQLGINRSRQQGECGQQVEPCAPLVVVQPPGWLGGWNKLTLQLIQINNFKLRVVKGRATDAEDVARALASADAVLSTLGGGGSVIADSTVAMVEAAHKTGVRRVVVLSSFFVERDRLGAVPRLLTWIAMGSVIKDKSAGEQLLRQSGLDWTIIYASVLKDGPVSGSVEVLPEGAKRRISDRISRSDVAAWMVQAATSSQLSRRSVGITEGTRTKEHVAREAVEHD